MNRETLLYNALRNVLYEVNEDHDLDTSNVIEKIKKRLESRMQTSSEEDDYKDLHTSWKEKGFDINHKFDLKDYDDFPVDSLFSIAINYKPCVLPNLAQVLIKAGANVQNEKGYLHACALARSPDVLKALIEAGISDCPHEHYGGNTALDCVTKLYGTDKSIEYKDCCKILIKHTLEQNPNEKMPDSVKNNKELAQCWNACEANNKGWELIDLATPSTETQVVSAQKANKSSYSIQ
ncbi:ankyrin repeat domain-containing protein [Wolbachia pipientis]|nr:ankyrin repeat domain-containing protein [Wolbachia pipientis]